MSTRQSRFVGGGTAIILLSVVLAAILATTGSGADDLVATQTATTTTAVVNSSTSPVRVTAPSSTTTSTEPPTTTTTLAPTTTIVEETTTTVEEATTTPPTTAPATPASSVAPETTTPETAAPAPTEPAPAPEGPVVVEVTQPVAPAPAPPAPAPAPAPAPGPGAPLGPLPGPLQRGAKDGAVGTLQQRLKDLHLDPGTVDGSFGTTTMYAVQAFQKVYGLAPTGVITDQEWNLLQQPLAFASAFPGQGANRTEVDLNRQLLSVWHNEQLVLLTHVSTGSRIPYCETTPRGGQSCGNAITPTGSFKYTRRIAGWRESDLGKLYNPVYFVGGIAVHGAASVPTHPASHGCVRIPMAIAEYFPTLVENGNPVFVY